MKKTEWFTCWFDTTFYHILYKHRNDNEAQHFISNLVDYLKPCPTSEFLDLACGKGRHAIYLNSLGHKVEGCDLSPNSITHAQKFENENLHFYVHDMREPTNKQYDFVLNLFTSIGFFESHDDNQKMFNAVYDDLNPKGTFVVDFLNAAKVKKELEPESVIESEGITFYIHKKIENNFVIKNIEFHHNDEHFSFFEKVELISFEQFLELGKKAGFKLKQTFGDYELRPYSKESDRLILIFEKE